MWEKNAKNETKNAFPKSSMSELRRKIPQEQRRLLVHIPTSGGLREHAEILIIDQDVA